jgi:hypothetical protein
VATTSTRHTRDTQQRISTCVDAVRALEEMRLKRFAPPPSGWFTLNEFMEESGRCISSARNSLSNMKRDGIIDTMKWAFLDSSNRTAYRTIYKCKKK